MWQVGVVFAALASFSGAVGDALVRLSFVVEEKRVRKARRQAKQAQQRKRERELKRSSFVSSVASTVRGENEGGEESAQSRFPGGHGSSGCDAGRQHRQLSCPSNKSSIGSGGGSTPECMQPVDRYEKDDRKNSISGRRQKGGRKGNGEREQGGDIKIRKRPLYLRPLWVLGTCFGTAINSLLSIISLDFASAAVVTPFAGLHIFWNVILSRFVLQVRRKELRTYISLGSPLLDEQIHSPRVYVSKSYRVVVGSRSRNTRSDVHSFSRIWIWDGDVYEARVPSCPSCTLRFSWRLS